MEARRFDFWTYHLEVSGPSLTSKGRKTSKGSSCQSDKWGEWGELKYIASFKLIIEKASASG
jgi:hypothetical protein